MHEGYDKEGQIEKTKKFKRITDWIGHNFESSSVETYEFAKFARQFRSFVKGKMPTSWKLLSLMKGHFYISGFIKKADNEIVYFSIGDVRYEKEWYNSILIRTAKHEKDCTGGRNNYANITNFFENIEKLKKEPTW